MTLITNNPPNQNFLQPTKFQIIFPRISTLTYFCQSVIIPGLSVIPAKQPSPFVDIYRPGEKMEYNIFTMNFILDEDLWSWELIHDWMKGYSFPEDFEEYKQLKILSEVSSLTKTPQYSDAELTILTALNNPRFHLKFIDMFPISISDTNLTVMESANVPVIATVHFKYQYYTIKRS